MAKQIIWSSKAKAEWFQILLYWIKRNQSKRYSIKLNSLLEEQLILIVKFPKIGRKTDIENVYVKLVRDYLVYYEFVNNDLYILTIRHGKRNLETLKLK